MLLSFLLVLGCTTPSCAWPNKHIEAQQAPTSEIEARQALNYTDHTIDMPINHFPHGPRHKTNATGTFKQHYYFDSTYYKEGGPVFLYISGETSGVSRFANMQTGIIQILMEATNGLGVILENRFYGLSYPFNTSTNEEIAYLTTEQTIADNAYFAQHVKFPGVKGNLTAPGTPWILYGGSLAGAQTAFSIKEYGDILYGGISSSGVIHAVLAYPEWYAPIQKLAPQDCIGSLTAIIDKFDHLVAKNETAAIRKMKELYGLGALFDLRDFAMTIAFPIGGPFDYPTNTWQELNWVANYTTTDFFDFCGNVTDVNAPEQVRAVDAVLANYTGGQNWTNLGNYANYVKKNIVSACPSPSLINTVSCFSTQNASYWADPTNSGDRSYLYTTCTESGFYQTAPATGPSLISRVLQTDYTQKWCDWAFGDSIPSTPNLTLWNRYGDLNFSADRLPFIDGEADVWLGGCYHSSAAGERRQQGVGENTSWTSARCTANMTTSSRRHPGTRSLVMPDNARGIVPEALRKGDTIAFISPSGRLNYIFPTRIARAKTYLEKAGFMVKIFFNTPEPKSFPEQVQQRVSELHSAFLDPTIRAIVCTIGGLSANELLRHIDYDIIRANPKIFCGYSDITLLHYAFLTQANLRTFYGPAAITSFGEYPEPLRFTSSHFFRTLQHGSHPPDPLPRSSEWTQQFLDWETPADTQPRTLQPNPGWKWVRPGSATGRLIGGCLPSILQLRGTIYEPDYTGKILILETPEFDKPNTPTPVEFVRSNLADLANAGFFERIVGLVLGRPYAYDEGMRGEFEEVVLQQCHGSAFPILAGMDFGHTDPILTLPLNALVRLDNEEDAFEVLEPAVV